LFSDAYGYPLSFYLFKNNKNIPFIKERLMRLLPEVI